MRTAHAYTIDLDGRRVEYRLVSSRTARRLLVRVGPSGVEVIQPTGRTGVDVESFLVARTPWVLDQLQRVERLRAVRRPKQRMANLILYRGEPTRIRLDNWYPRARSNKVSLQGDEIVVLCGGSSMTLPHRSLELWLRAQARVAIEAQLGALMARLRQRPTRVYIMGQRTKWGNCSGQRNLSFNWRLILAPDFVLRYLVTHEAVHLAVPDHSAKFWLTVQSLCPKVEKAKQWLNVNNQELHVDLDKVVKDARNAGCLTIARSWPVSS